MLEFSELTVNRFGPVCTGRWTLALRRAALIEARRMAVHLAISTIENNGGSSRHDDFGGT